MRVYQHNHPVSELWIWSQITRTPQVGRNLIPCIKYNIDTGLCGAVLRASPDYCLASLKTQNEQMLAQAVSNLWRASCRGKHRDLKGRMGLLILSSSEGS